MKHIVTHIKYFRKRKKLWNSVSISYFEKLIANTLVCHISRPVHKLSVHKNTHLHFIT